MVFIQGIFHTKSSLKQPGRAKTPCHDGAACADPPLAHPERRWDLWAYYEHRVTHPERRWTSTSADHTIRLQQAELHRLQQAHVLYREQRPSKQDADAQAMRLFMSKFGAAFAAEQF